MDHQISPNCSSRLLKHAGLRIAGYARWSASAGMNQTNRSVDGRKVEMLPFDHPWCELDDLFRGECLLRNKPAHDGIADLQRSRCLLHGQPAALLRRRACREALGMANVLYAFLCPCVADAGAIPQSVQDRDDGAVFTDQSELANQLRYFLRVDVIVMAGPVLAHCQLGVNATCPVQLEMHRGRIIRCIRHDFFKDRAEECASSMWQESSGDPTTAPDHRRARADVPVVRWSTVVLRWWLLPDGAPSRRPVPERCSIASPVRRRQAGFPAQWPGTAARCGWLHSAPSEPRVRASGAFHPSDSGSSPARRTPLVCRQAAAHREPRRQFPDPRVFPRR